MRHIGHARTGPIPTARSKADDGIASRNEAAMARKDPVSAVLRGACALCPNCGRGRLFRAYLKPVEACAECHEPLKHIRADDGPAWLTILIVGHVVVGFALSLEMYAPLPVATSVALCLVLSVAMVLSLLPRAKGMFVGAIWAMDATGADLKRPAQL
jgi:uncharacterized protein (DUF983 family)